MNKIALLLFASLMISACAAFNPNPPPTIHPARVTPAAPLKKKLLDEVPNPFQSKAEEALFWKVMDGEATDAEIAPIKDTPGFKIAIAMRILISCQSTDQQLRGAMMQMLTAHIARIYMTDETHAAVLNDLVSDEMKNRWKALHFTFEQQAKGTAIIWYILNDEENLIAFFKKEAVKCEALKKATPDGKSFKPAPPATSSPSNQVNTLGKAKKSK